VRIDREEGRGSSKSDLRDKSKQRKERRKKILRIKQAGCRLVQINIAANNIGSRGASDLS